MKNAKKSWGIYTVIDVQPGSMTVKVSMKAGEHMTYHMHNHEKKSGRLYLAKANQLSMVWSKS